MIPTNLPVQLTSFIGRQREIAEVRRLLENTRLLMLVGAGGCGKTRLASEVATSLREKFPDAVWFVDLAPVSDPSLVPQTLAAIFDLHESGDIPLTNILRSFFSAKDLLIVLDNCEHVVEACATLCDVLLRGCPRLRILATSREALNIGGETVFGVLPLGLADPNEWGQMDTLIRSESVRLFVERATAVRSDFQLAESNARLVAQICQQLDGIPLAIELATSRVNSLAIEEIAARLDDRFRLLNSGGRTTLPRHQTLRASVDWSYGLLSDSERALLQRLAVFAGGFTVEAVESICDEDARSQILELLSRLVQKSLVVVRLDDKPRYRLLESIRQYAREKLVESGDEDAVRDRHLRYFMNFAEVAAAKLHGPEQMRTLEWLDSELDNSRAALEWSVSEGRVEQGLRLATALMWYWERRGYFSEGLAHVSNLLNQPEAAAKAQIRGHGLVAAGLMTGSKAAVWVGGSKASRPYLEEAIAIAREQGQAGNRLRALALTLLSNSVFGDDPVLALSQYDEAWAIVRELNDPWSSALLLHQRGHWLEDQDIEAAGKAFEDSLALFRASGDKRWTAILLNDIAICIYPGQGNYAGARTLLESNLSYFRETRDRMHTCFSLGHLAEISRLEGNYELVTRYYSEALPIGRALGASFCLRPRP